MSKTLLKLIKREQLTGKAILNGRIKEYDFGHTYISDLQEKYAIETLPNGFTELRHWGTTLIQIHKESNSFNPLSLYGESNSDRDAINYFLNYYNIPVHCHYYPSRDTFEFHWNHNDSLINE